MTYATRPASCPCAVNKPLTPKRRYRAVENDQYAAFLRRVIRAYSRRVAAGDIEAITAMARLADDLDDATRQAITGLRAVRLLLGRHRHAARHHPPRRPATLGHRHLTEHGHDPDGTRAGREPPVTRPPARCWLPRPEPARLRARGRTPDPPHRTPSSPTNASFAAACTTPDTARWLDHVWHAAACTRPIRLRGDIKHIDPATGELLRTIPTDGMPDGAIYKPCGNRRATTCPGCAETYRRDAYHLIRAGLIGGKGITPAVAAHPAVFATFTAPSFGPVHTRPVRQHTCTDRYPLHLPGPSPATPAATPATLRARPARRLLHPAPPRRPPTRPAAVPGLLRLQRPRRVEQPGRGTVAAHQASHRTPPRPARPPPRRTPDPGSRGDGKTRLVDPVRVAHGKAAEYQARGAVHFHVLLRLDGYDPADPGRDPPPAAGHHRRRPRGRHPPRRRRHQPTAPRRTRPSPAAGPSGWGNELDVRVITMRGTGTVTDLAVASYLAKYSTKGTETTGHASARITPDTIDLYANPDGTHPERLIHACWTLGRRPRTTPACAAGPTCSASAATSSPKPAATPSASPTCAKPASSTGAASDTGPEHGPIRAADHADDETILIIGTFTYAGTGWTTTGDALLANTAADQARKRRQAGHDELADEYNHVTPAARPHKPAGIC